MAFQSDLVLELLARLRRFKRAAERGLAQGRFALEGKRRLSVLTAEQINQYHDAGYQLVSGLIPDEIARAAEAAMWACYGVSADAPEHWAKLGPPSCVFRDERLVASYTDAVLAAAAQLSGEDVASFPRPARVRTVNQLPRTCAWHPHTPHIDHALAEQRHRTFPRPFRIGAITYLTDVQRHGGGTIVWPGSHLKVAALARSDPLRYKYVSVLNADLGRVELGDPVELTPSRGDVLFHHHLCAHASSDNVRTRPRLAIFHKW